MTYRESIIMLIVSLGIFGVAISAYMSGDIDKGEAALGFVLMTPCAFVAVKGITGNV